MVVYVGMENGQNKTVNTHFFDMTSNQTLDGNNCECGFENNQHSHLFPQKPNGKNPRTKIRIITGSTQPQNIGLHVNTNLHLKPKKRLGFNILNVILFCLLLAYLIWTALELRGLRRELDLTKMKLDVLTNSLESLTRSFYEVEKETLKLLEIFIEEKATPEEGHSLQKRAVEPPTACADCTNGTRQARSVSRGPFAIHLKGALPEITIRDGGIIAPWYIDKTSSGVFLLEDGVVGEGRGIVEIIEEGLYFIYAQMYYLTSDALNSYAINLQLGEEGGRGVRRDVVVAVCSAEAASHKLSELSCYTAVVRYLRRGDRIFVTQRERNRKIIFRDNRSFLGLTLLNSPHGFTQ
uniref:THD domain-containing protein n=1 Tax=Graphocephala atropunctata TaxID=36148 RepID=A0A1B6KA82_9HEMI